MIDAQDREILLDKEKLNEEKKKFEQDYADHQKLLDDWRVSLKEVATRRLMWDILGLCGYQKDMFSSDALVMAANCGQYKIVINLIKVMEEAVPGILFRMQNEFRSAQANKDK